MIPIYAEIDTSGQRILLMAAGPINEAVFVAKQLQQATPLFSDTNPKGALLCPLTWAACVQLTAIYGAAWQPGPHLQAWINQHAAQRIAPLTAPLTMGTPEGLTPWPHQLEGANLIAATGRALLFDEPRTGKTITTILGLRELTPWPFPLLVVCPAAVVDPWLEALEDWAPDWRAVRWAGADRRALVGTADVYVSSYEGVVRDAIDTNPGRSPLIALDPRGVVVDECHYLKSQASKRSHAVRRVARNAKAFVALSGTPITHHPADLWPTLVGLAPGAWPARERWVNRYCTSGVVDYGESILGLHPGNEPEFRMTLLGQYRRVARADLGWAPKSYEVRTVEMPEEYRKSYDQFENEMLAELPDDGGELSVMDVLTQFTFLSRLACSASDVEITYGPETDEQTGEPKKHTHVNPRNPSWTIDELLKVLRERGADEPTVAFAESKPLALMAGEAAEKTGRRVGYIIGGQSRKKRTATRLAFQRGELDLVCATVGAGGVGITLNAAKAIVFLQRPWSLVQSIQAEDRGVGEIDAPGCHVIDIVVRDTIQSRVRAVLRERAGQLADLVMDPRIVAELLGGASVSQLRKAS